MIASKEDLLKAISNLAGDNTSDLAIRLLEDVADTIDSLSPAEPAEDWKAKYEALNSEWETKYNENDSEWRRKYTERFLNTEPAVETEAEEIVEVAPATFEELFD